MGPSILSSGPISNLGPHTAKKNQLNETCIRQSQHSEIKPIQNKTSKRKQLGTVQRRGGCTCLMLSFLVLLLDLMFFVGIIFLTKLVLPSLPAARAPMLMLYSTTLSCRGLLVTFPPHIRTALWRVQRTKNYMSK